MIKSFFAREIYQPVYNIYKKDSRQKYFKLYKRLQWGNINQNKKIQAHELYRFIKYCTEEIPYYKKILKQRKISFAEETIFNDIKKFPILTKDIIRKEFKNLYKIRKNVKWYNNQSGGSTGEAIKLIQDSEYQATGSAMTKLQMEWAGFNEGDELIMLWGSEKDLYKEKENIKHRFSNWINSVILLNSFLMGSKDMEKYLCIINKKHPKLILAYAESIYELAKFAESTNTKVYSPKAIMSSATMLYPHQREKIEKIFKCKVFDRYGSREVGNIACECEKHEGLHVSMYTHYVEILDKNMKPCREGETGEIYITLLNNFTMPLIRYKIGDMAQFTEKLCSCGRGLTLIKSIKGRISNFFIKRDGTKIDSNFFDFPIWDKDWIISYQIIQKNYNKILYRMKTKFKPSKKELKKIEHDIKYVMGEDCEVVFEFVDTIVPTKSGKYLYTIVDFENEK